MRSVVLLLTVAMLLPQSVCAVERLDNGGDYASSNTTKKLPDNSIRLAEGVTYFTTSIDDNRAHVVRVDLSTGKCQIKPLVSEARETTSDLCRRAGCLAAINGGYFNLTDGESASFVSIDGKTICDPRGNRALIENPRLKPFLEKILNRSELRILSERDGRIAPVIAPHFDSIEKGSKLLHSLQAGPLILPVNRSRAEAFIRTEPSGKTLNSIGTKSKAARSAVGFTRNGVVLLVCVEGARDREFSKGVSLSQLSRLMKKLGCMKALNLDGGTSATMVIADGGGARTRTVFANETERRVKSVLGVTTLIAGEE